MNENELMDNFFDTVHYQDESGEQFVGMPAPSSDDDDGEDGDDDGEPPSSGPAMINNQIILDPLPEPTEAQRHSGNYKKHHLRVQGLDIAIENPKGSVRRGVDADGNEWETVMPAHYGYLKRTDGADGDQVDIYIGPDENSEMVFVIEQKDLVSGKYDEDKVVLGVASPEEARALYTAGFSDGRGEERIMRVAPMTITEFKEWMKNG